MGKQEVRQARSRLEEIVPRPAPFVIYLDPCGACNFKCSFCPCNISDERSAERHAVMSWELFEKILSDLRAFKGQVRVINLYGFGEPLLNPRLADMVRALKENRCCREVRVTTNGSLLTEAKSRALIEAGVDLVRVSVEAISSEGYRALCGVRMDFTEIVRNIETFHTISMRGGDKQNQRQDCLRRPADRRGEKALCRNFCAHHGFSLYRGNRADLERVPRDENAA